MGLLTKDERISPSSTPLMLFVGALGSNPPGFWFSRIFKMNSRIGVCPLSCRFHSLPPPHTQSFYATACPYPHTLIKFSPWLYIGLHEDALWAEWHSYRIGKTACSVILLRKIVSCQCATIPTAGEGYCLHALHMCFPGRRSWLVLVRKSLYSGRAWPSETPLQRPGNHVAVRSGFQSRL